MHMEVYPPLSPPPPIPLTSLFCWPYIISQDICDPFVLLQLLYTKYHNKNYSSIYLNIAIPPHLALVIASWYMYVDIAIWYKSFINNKLAIHLLNA